MFPAILVTGHFLIYNSEELYFSALEDKSNFILLFPLSSAMSKGLIKREEQRYHLIWNRIFDSRYLVNIWSVPKVKQSYRKLKERQILKILKYSIQLK